MIASLMMYARPELDAAHSRYWASIRAELAARGIDSPAALSNGAPTFDVWKADDLVLSQTCGMPYRQHLTDHAVLVGTPDFGLEDCAPGYYRSTVVVRAGDARVSLDMCKDARFAYSGAGSQSGYAALYNDLAAQGWWFTDRVQSGGHLISARMVAQGDADVASLDAVTWRLIQRYEPWADQLRVLAWTSQTPGLPYITAKGSNVAAIRAAVDAAIGGLSAQDRQDLGIRALIQIPEAAYLAVPNPPSETPSETP